MPRADLRDDFPDKIVVTTEWHERDLIRQVPGRSHHAKAGVWTVPLSWGAALGLRGVFGEQLEVGPALVQWSIEHYEKHVEPALELRALLAPSDGVVEEGLYPFQEVVVMFLRAAERALVASEMGTGKSVTANRSMARVEDPFPALIVSPNSMKSVWAEELAKWLPGADVRVVDGVKDCKPGADVYVVNWEKLRTLSRLAPYGSIRLKRCMECGGTDPAIKSTACEVHLKALNLIAWRTVIADEAHRVKDPKTKQARALWWLGGDVKTGARYRFALTGTPVSGKPQDLWGLMHFVAPEDWPSRSLFLDRYCDKGFNYWGAMEVTGIRSEPEIRQEFYRILDPRMIRHLKSQVLPQLPPKVFQTRTVEMAVKQRRAYDELKKEMLTELDNGILVTTNALTKTTRLLQLAAGYMELEEDSTLEKPRYRMTSPSCKVDALLELLEELGDQQAVVFAESRQLIGLCEKALSDANAGYVSIHGGISTSDRGLAMKRFQAGEVQLCLGTYGAASEGLTLTAASIMIRLQRTYDAVKDGQSQDRIHRIGQEADRALYIDIVTANTVEARIPLSLGVKGSYLEEVVRDQDALRALIGG